MGECLTFDCSRPVRARGYCVSCYNRLRKSGDLSKIQGTKDPMKCIRCEKRARAGHSYCRECHAVYERERRQALPQEERDKINRRARETRNDDPARFWAYRLVRYGITVEEYNDLLAAQLGACAICGRQMREPHIDHDHKCCSQKMRSCGRCIRGLLCTSCNNGLGRFQDDPDRLRAAADYIERGEPRHG